jgi:DNA-binding LacI/PurR family transcriptional regulator
LILSGPTSDDPLLRQLTEERYPLILHGQLEGNPLPSVDVDNRAGGYQATSHLIAGGHHRIGFISNAPLSYAGTQDRYAGYKQALSEHDLPLDRELVRTAAFMPDSGRRAMRELLSVAEPPGAIFAASDVVALGAMTAIHDAGLRIPEDVAVVGFDDIFLAAHVWPPLTTVRVPAYGLGWTAAEILIRFIEGEEDVASVSLETELVVRKSCGAHRALQTGHQQH